MNMIIRRLAMVVIAVFVLQGLALAELTVSQITKKYSPSVVTIVALDENDQPLSLGSGFFINKTGDIVTNHHVLEGSARAIIKTLKGEKGRIIEIVKDDPKLDLLVARTSLKNTLPIPLGDSDAITVGEDIIAIGNPAGLEGTVSKGIISGIRKAEGIKFIQITAPISPGSSGGPVLNLSGRVIGVATAYLDLGQNLNFAMPVNLIKGMKPIRIRLTSLPAMTTKLEDVGRDKTLVEVFDIHYNTGGAQHLYSIDLAIKNDSNYPIRNIKLFFVYRNYQGQIVSYSYEDFKKSILPKLALQFSHRHYVGHWRKYYGKKKWGAGTVEIRILDYKIDRSVRGSPVDLLLE